MKSIYIKCAIVFCCLSASLCLASEEKEEISVVLGSEHSLLPTMVEKIEQGQDSGFGADYLSRIRSVLLFDINNNGMTRALEGKEQELAEATLGAPSYEGALDLEKLREKNVSYLIRWKMADKTLSAKVVQITSGTSRVVTPITLSGDLSKDRSKIHQLADCIHSMLFGKPGIADTKIVYTIKRKIVAEQKEPTFLSEVVEADYDGCNIRPVTNTHSLCVTPALIPHQRKGTLPTLLYVSYELGQPKIFARSPSDGHVYRLTLMRGNQLTPAVSKDGSMVAFCSDITGTADLYVVPFEEDIGSVGKPRQVFHSKGAATACPTFSPDGKKIAFVSNKDGSAKIYIMDVPPSGTKVADLNPRLITKRCRDNTAPSWSPDGKKIAYSAKNQGDRQIWIYDIERDKEEQLTDGKGGKESPSWAPDSLHLIFHGYSGGNADIYLVNLNQPKPVKISNGPGDKQFPCWAP